MLFLSSFVFMVLLDISLSEQTSFTLSDTNPNDPSLKSVVIKGIAKYKPGGSAMILSLLIRGPPGMMPAGNVQGQPGQTPTTGPSSSGGTSAPSGSSSSTGPTSSTTKPATTPATGPTTTSPSTSGPSSGSTGDFKDYEQKALQEHNRFRQVHGSQVMKLNKKMCEDAQAYAEKIAASRNFQHSNKDERSGQGENLSMGCSSKAAQTVEVAVTNWYNEVCSPGYNFDQGRRSGTGHFTQVVWNDSTELGIGRAESSENGMKCAYIVGRYKPLGNFDTGNNDYTKNVKQGSFDRSSYCAKASKSRDQINNQQHPKSFSQILKRSFHKKHLKRSFHKKHH